MAAGYIYLLVNSSITGLVKIGKTEREPLGRADELSSATGIPTPFVVGYHIFVNDCDEAERRVHHQLASFRANLRREFFQVSATDAIHVIQNVCGELTLQAPKPSVADECGKTSAVPEMVNRMNTVERMRGQMRRYERLGPVVAELRTRIRRAHAWVDLLVDVERRAERLRDLSPEFLWIDMSKAARAASTVSLRAHDELLEVQEPLREITRACREFRDFALHELNTWGRLSASELDYTDK